METNYDFYSKKEVTELHYNYRMAVSDGNEIFPEDYNTATVGNKGVVSIHEHETRGEWDRWFFDIVYSNSRTERVFNPCRVFYNS